MGGFYINRQREAYANEGFFVLIFYFFLEKYLFDYVMLIWWWYCQESECDSETMREKKRGEIIK